MRHAAILLRHTDSYRADAFGCGLVRLGFELDRKPKSSPRPGDLLLIWNRTRAYDLVAQRYESAGAHVIVAENGYIGTDDAGGKLFAMARRHHNGAGSWYVGPEPRRSFDMKPWRDKGDHILLLPQRGIGIEGVRMPTTWLANVRNRLARLTRRPVRIRQHPGAAKSDPWPDLKGAHCAITWGSGAGIKAIAHGIPVFHEFGRWIGAPAARFGIADIEDCFLGDRVPMFHRLSWAQWSIREIQGGEAFKHLIDD